MGNFIAEGWIRQGGRQFNLWMEHVLQVHGRNASTPSEALRVITEQAGEGAYRLINEHGAWVLYYRPAGHAVTDERSGS